MAQIIVTVGDGLGCMSIEATISLGGGGGGVGVMVGLNKKGEVDTGVTIVVRSVGSSVADRDTAVRIAAAVGGASD